MTKNGWVQENRSLDKHASIIVDMRTKLQDAVRQVEEMEENLTTRFKEAMVTYSELERQFESTQESWAQKRVDMRKTSTVVKFERAASCQIARRVSQTSTPPLSPRASMRAK